MNISGKTRYYNVEELAVLSEPHKAAVFFNGSKWQHMPVEKIWSSGIEIDKAEYDRLLKETHDLAFEASSQARP